MVGRLDQNGMESDHATKDPGIEGGSLVAPTGPGNCAMTRLSASPGPTLATSTSHLDIMD